MFGILNKFRLTVFGDEVFPILINIRKYRKMSQFLLKSQFWSKDEIIENQTNRLKKLIEHCNENVPYYKKKFCKINIKPKDMKDISNLQNLPFLTKQDIKDNTNSFRARNYQGHKFENISTGGTTGTPLKFFVEKDIWYVNDMAFNSNAIYQIASSIKGKYVFLRHHLIRSSKKENFWKYTIFGRWLLLSSYHLSEKNMQRYIELIRKFKPKFFIGYPSSISLLASFMNNNSIESFNGIELVICGGENLYDWQNHLIKKKFNCNILNIYGHAERTLFAATCSKSNFHHFYPQYGILELINKEGNCVSKEGEIGEIVGTGFCNNIFPFIRYRTGDLGVLTIKKCSCGRNYPMLKKIQGRKQEFVVSKNGSLLPLSGIFGLVGRNSNNILFSQFYQELQGELILKINKGHKYTDLDEKRIKKAFFNRYTNEIDLVLDYVSGIPQTNNGRHNFLIQKLHIDFYNKIL